MTTATPEVSVIVPTRDQAARLSRCLYALRADSSEVSREVVVVDNGSTDHTAAIVALHASQSAMPVRRVWEPRVGASRARNSGIASTHAPFIFFADDDTTVHDGWADALRRAFESGAVVAVGGRILPAWEGTPPQWLLDGPQVTNATLEDYGAHSFRCSRERLPFGANLALRRSSLASIAQPFDERLGHRGRSAMGAEEWHLLKQLLPFGEVRYEAAAVADHHVSATRMEYTTVRRRMWQLGFGNARSARILGEPQPAWIRVLVRSVKIGIEAAGERRRHSGADLAPAGDEAWRDFYTHFWWGLHMEMLVGRVQRIADLLAERLLGP